MSGLLFVIPLLLGLGVIALTFKIQLPKGQTMSRPILGLALIVGSLLWWASSAMLLAGEGKFFVLLNAIVVATFFIGLAFFFPQPPGSTQTNQHSLPASILIWMGLILGVTHVLALLFTEFWPATLIEFYTSIGLHG
jgi:hypothetical protein